MKQISYSLLLLLLTSIFFVYTNEPYDNTYEQRLFMSDEYEYSLEESPSAFAPHESEGNAQVYPAISEDTYFSNLLYYTPSNQEGSCGYVSLIQLMSYYDTYLDDNIIPEIYDRNGLYNSYASIESDKFKSPGVIREHNYSNNYEGFVLDTKSYNLQSELIYINNLTGNFKDWENSTKIEEYQRILDNFYGSQEFVYVNPYSLGKIYVSDPNKQNKFKKYIKDKIDEGKPVIVHISEGEFGDRHSVVAYAYDNDIIYANYGWNGEYTCVPLLNEKYTTIYYVCTLEYQNNSVKPSNNYSIGGISYNGLGRHSHDYNYQNFDEDEHYTRCDCGYCHKHFHKVSLGGGRYRTCELCGAIVDMNKVILPIENVPLNIIVSEQREQEHIDSFIYDYPKKDTFKL